MCHALSLSKEAIDIYYIIKGKLMSYSKLITLIVLGTGFILIY